MTSNFLFLSFSTLHSRSLWRTDTTIVAKFNKPPPPLDKSPSLLSAPSPLRPLKLVWNKYNKPAQGVNGVFTVFVKQDVLTNSEREIQSSATHGNKKLAVFII